MIVWLASYPRSGNTLLRMILHRCFGVSSYTIYGRARADPSLTPRTGTLQYDDSTPEAFVNRARQSEETFYIKSHDFPAPEHAEIYIVRDGRAALASYQRFLRDREGLSVELEKLISGGQWPGSWEGHVKQWLERPGARQLVLRFEELCGQDGPPLERIGSFLGKPILRRFDVEFEELRTANSVFFGVGRNEPGIELVERTYSKLFWRVNGDAMRRMGYAPRLSIVDTLKSSAERVLGRGLMRRVRLR